MEDNRYRDLVERLTRGDEAALRELIADLGPRLLRTIARMLGGHRGEAEDVLQEVLIRFWRNRYRLNPDENVRAYLFTIATNLCLNRMRGLRRAPQLLPLGESSDETALPEPRDASPGPEQLAGSAQLGRRLVAEIAALPDNQRATLLLRHEAGLSYQEIAAVLEVSAAAVESLLHRARSRLRERLGEWLTEGNLNLRGRRE
jgi:RNA polymerase sigma factor (sigma-70 family)